MEDKRCLYCRARFTPLRNPNQSYCGKLACQRIRRNRYQKKKLKQAEYKETYLSSLQKWRCRHSDYWRHYRLQHPAYVAANRMAQVKRDKKRGKSKETATVPVLAKMYSLFPKNTDLSSNYSDFLGKPSLLAKMYFIGKSLSTLLTSSDDYLPEILQRSGSSSY